MVSPTYNARRNASARQPRALPPAAAKPTAVRKRAHQHARTHVGGDVRVRRVAAVDHPAVTGVELDLERDLRGGGGEEREGGGGTEHRGVSGLAEATLMHRESESRRRRR